MGRASVALLLFAKLPRAGTVKTRLAPHLGAQGAAELATAFLADASRRLAAIRGAEPVVAADPSADDPSWRRTFPSPWRIEPQGGGDLGARLRRAFEREFRTHPRVAAIGADHPALSCRVLEAFLSERDAIWPSSDGGYAAIVLGRSPHALSLFEEIPWSTPEVLAATLARASAAGVRLRLYPQTFDVDTPGDLPALSARLSAWTLEERGYPGHTAAALARRDTRMGAPR